MARNFIIFHAEREGSTAIIQSLSERLGVTIVHQENDRGWEPFNKVCCGEMPMRTLFHCLDVIYGNKPIDFPALNARYTKTAFGPIEAFPPSEILGLKMRFRPPWRWEMALPPARWLFNKQMVSLLRRHNIYVFVTIRQDVMRWALSKYYGNGKRIGGHLQYSVAAGKIDPSALPKVTVDLGKFERIVQEFERKHVINKRLIGKLQSAGVQASPLLYETFASDPSQFYGQMFDALGVPHPAIDPAQVRSTYRLNKVHSDDISSFVVNADDVIARFGNRFARWA
jgi:hypothetical protein